MPRKTHKQAAQLRTLTKARLRKTLGYAHKLSPFIHKWEAEGLSQRGIVDMLNWAGALVPSEYTGEEKTPEPVKQRSLIQYQRFRKQVDVIAEKMKWSAVRRKAKHTRPYGDGKWLFASPLVAGLPEGINRPSRMQMLNAELERMEREYKERHKNDLPVDPYAPREFSGHEWRIDPVTKQNQVKVNGEWRELPSGPSRIPLGPKPQLQGAPVPYSAGALAQAHEEALQEDRERAEARPPEPDRAVEETDQRLLAANRAWWREYYRGHRKT